MLCDDGIWATIIYLKLGGRGDDVARMKSLVADAKICTSVVVSTASVLYNTKLVHHPVVVVL